MKLRPLTIDEARALPVGLYVWMEQSGGYDGCRYKAEPVKITDNTNDVMMFGGSGRAYSITAVYAAGDCGWTTPHTTRG